MPQRIEQFGRLVGLGARRTPHRVAFKYRDGPARTYRELDERTNRLANALLGTGLQRGDRVAVWLGDTLEYLELYVAVAKAGLVIVPVNERFTPYEAAYLLDDAKVSALVFGDAQAEAVSGLLSERDVQVLVAVGAERPAGAMRFADLLTASSSQPVPPDEDDLFIIGYTSGTTGFPKGAMITHRSLKNIARMNAVSYRLPMGSICAFTGSMSFVATVTAFVPTHLLLGGTVIMMGRWEVDDLLDLVERERATYTYVPTPRLREFAAAAAQRPESWASLASVLHGGSKAVAEDLALVADAIGGRLVEGWGMTENSGGLVTATTADDVTGRSEADDIFASAGRPTVDVAVRVVDSDGTELPHDGRSVGELAFQSPALMDGYWNAPEATAAVLRDGWYHTGDLGYIDPAGYVYVSDRRNDLIVSGGMNVYPSEVERIIAQLPGVAEVAVVAAPHERWGQTVAAFVVTDPGVRMEADDVVSHCRTYLASYKKPTRVTFVGTLPRNASGKILRRTLRQVSEQQQEG